MAKTKYYAELSESERSLPPHFSLGKCIFVILFFTIYIFYATLLCGGELPLLK